MTPEAALAAGSTALSLKVPLVAWLAILILLSVDRRKNNATVTWIVFGLVVFFASFSGWNGSSSRPLALTWLVSVGCSLLVVVAAVWAWIVPRSANVGRTVAITLAVCGIAVCGWITADQFVLESGRAIWSVAIHQLGVLLAMAISLVCGVELTFLTSPETQLAKPEKKSASMHEVVRFQWLAMAAAVAFALEAFVAGAILLDLLQGEFDAPKRVLLLMFAVSVLVMQFVSWMIPHRLAGFQRSPKPAKASDAKKSRKSNVESDWPTLALASWLVLLALAVTAALPSGWPWSEN